MRKLNNPPQLVKDVMEVVGMLFSIKPEKLPGGATNYWPAIVKQCLTSKDFLKKLIQYDVWNLRGNTLKRAA